MTKEEEIEIVDSILRAKEADYLKKKYPKLPKRVYIIDDGKIYKGIPIAYSISVRPNLTVTEVDMILAGKEIIYNLSLLISWLKAFPPPEASVILSVKYRRDGNPASMYLGKNDIHTTYYSAFKRNSWETFNNIFETVEIFLISGLLITAITDKSLPVFLLSVLLMLTIKWKKRESEF